jgi:hypothetical protein
MKPSYSTLVDTQRLIEEYERIITDVAFQINECQREVKKAQDALAEQTQEGK